MQRGHAPERAAEHASKRAARERIRARSRARTKARSRACDRNVDLTVTVSAVQQLYDGATEWMQNTFGEDAAEKFQGFMDGVKSVVQAVIFVKVIVLLGIIM